MFTGLVEATGQLVSSRARASGYRLSIRHALGRLDEGESLSVNGACLTVVAPTRDGFQADVSAETTRVTTLGSVPEGARLNLERALGASDRFGGHLVTGHVDAVTEIVELERSGDALCMRVALPRAQAPFVAAKGSVSLDGVSLTVNAVDALGFEVMLIPHTLKVTNLGEASIGRKLNLEVDLVARYVARWVETRGDEASRPSATAGQDTLERTLKRSGLM